MSVIFIFFWSWYIFKLYVYTNAARISNIKIFHSCFTIFNLFHCLTNIWINRMNINVLFWVQIWLQSSKPNRPSYHKLFWQKKKLVKLQRMYLTNSFYCYRFGNVHVFTSKPMPYICSIYSTLGDWNNNKFI